MRIDAQPSLEMMTLHTPLPSKKIPEPKSEVGMIHVEFSPETTIGIKHLRQFAHTLDAERYTAGIFITIGTVTTAALRAFEPLREQGIIAEHFQEQDLLVNITKHELVPKHYLMSPEEKAALLKRYRLKQSQLPKIQSRDPVAKYLGLKSGQVVKIIRKSETAGRYAELQTRAVMAKIVIWRFHDVVFGRASGLWTTPHEKGAWAFTSDDTQNTLLCAFQHTVLQSVDDGASSQPRPWCGMCVSGSIYFRALKKALVGTEVCRRMLTYRESQVRLIKGFFDNCIR